MIPFRSMFLVVLLLVTVFHHLLSRRPPPPPSPVLESDPSTLRITPWVRRAAEPGAVVQYKNSMARRIRRCRVNCEDPSTAPPPPPF